MIEFQKKKKKKGLTEPKEFIVYNRKESNTGWISVVEDKNRGIIVMRSDHSIIGGVYKTNMETIFGIFNVMEVVKLTRPFQQSENSKMLQM